MAAYAAHSKGTRPAWLSTAWFRLLARGRQRAARHGVFCCGELVWAPVGGTTRLYAACEHGAESPSRCKACCWYPPPQGTGRCVTVAASAWRVCGAPASLTQALSCWVHGCAADCIPLIHPTCICTAFWAVRSHMPVSAAFRDSWCAVGGHACAVCVCYCVRLSSMCLPLLHRWHLFVGVPSTLVWSRCHCFAYIVMAQVCMSFLSTWLLPAALLASPAVHSVVILAIGLQVFQGGEWLATCCEVQLVALRVLSETPVGMRGRCKGRHTSCLARRGRDHPHWVLLVSHREG